jgi:cardiolipin synthase
MNWNFYLKPEDAWKAMLEDCQNAKASIELEQYIFNNDEIGGRFIEVLLERAKKGVTVRLICDAAGSFSFFNSSTPDFLARAGVQIRFFNPISPWRINNFSSWFFRDHRKILVVDSSIGYTGGVGINFKMKGWRDTHVKITGPIVLEIQQAFERMWRGIGTGKFVRLKNPQDADAVFSFLTNAPRFHERFLYHRLLKILLNARKYIYISTPYFIPNKPIFKSLRMAAKNGVDVRLLLSCTSDHRFVDIASNGYFDKAFKAGIKIFCYRNGVLHGKTVVVDDCWASVGSANFDNLSFVFNHEAILAGKEPRFVGELKKIFHKDLRLSDELKRLTWQRRPFFQKLLELLIKPFHPIM